jgi:hypothetical protein
MFRASPWISYEPAESKNHPPAPAPIATTVEHVDEDVDMDAPQISILREEQTPPPQPTRTSKFRVKLLVNDTGVVSPSPSSASRKQTLVRGDDEAIENDEDEEDQLIDDDDEINPATLPLSPKRKPSHKRKPKKTEKRMTEEDRKAKEKSQIQAGAQIFVHT